jgi:hypothetical protein
VGGFVALQEGSVFCRPLLGILRRKIAELGFHQQMKPLESQKHIGFLPCGVLLWCIQFPAGPKFTRHQPPNIVWEGMRRWDCDRGMPKDRPQRVGREIGQSGKDRCGQEILGVSIDGAPLRTELYTREVISDLSVDDRLKHDLASR